MKIFNNNIFIAFISKRKCSNKLNRIVLNVWLRAWKIRLLTVTIYKPNETINHI
jgi:hypothetical protein